MSSCVVNVSKEVLGNLIAHCQAECEYFDHLVEDEGYEGNEAFQFDFLKYKLEDILTQLGTRYEGSVMLVLLPTHEE